MRLGVRRARSAARESSGSRVCHRSIRRPWWSSGTCVFVPARERRRLAVACPLAGAQVHDARLVAACWRTAFHRCSGMTIEVS
jgi:hypothetical protein